MTGGASSGHETGPPPRPVPDRSAPVPNAEDETTVFLMEMTDREPAEENGR